MEQTHTIEPAHVAAGIGAGIVSRALGVLAVGKGWIGPKLTAGLMACGGLAAIGAGLAAQSGWMTAAGAGLAASGILSLVTQAAIGLYEAIDGDLEEQESKRQLPPQTDAEASAAQVDERAQEPATEANADTEARAKRSQRNAAKRARKRQKRHKPKKGAKHRNGHHSTEEKAAEAIDDDPDRAAIPAG